MLSADIAPMPLCKGRGWGGIAFCCGAIRSILSPPSGSCLFLLPIMCLALSAALGRRLCEGQLVQAGVDVLRPSSHPHLNPLPSGRGRRARAKVRLVDAASRKMCSSSFSHWEKVRMRVTHLTDKSKTGKRRNPQMETARAATWLGDVTRRFNR